MGHHGFYLPMFGGGSLITLILTILMVGLVATLVLRHLRGGNLGCGNHETDRNHSLDILKNRLAQGEISEQEYLRMREILEK